MTNIEHIQRLSRIMQILCDLLIIALPLILLVLFLYFDAFAAAAAQAHGIRLMPEALQPLNRVLALICLLIPIGVSLYGLFRLRALFGLYRQTIFFTGANVRHLRAFAGTLLINALLSPVVGALLSMVLTMNNPPGQKQLHVSISSNQIMLAFVAGIFLVIAWIMVEGRRLADENAEII